MKKLLKWAGIIIGALLIFGMIFTFSGCVEMEEAETVKEAEEEATVEEVAEETEVEEIEAEEPADDHKELWEWKLASIKAKNPDLPKDDPTVWEFSKHLDRLEKKTNQNRQEISDTTVRAWEILKEDVNPKEDLLKVIYDLDYSIPDDIDIKLELSEVAAAYITLRRQGAE